MHSCSVQPVQENRLANLREILRTRFDGVIADLARGIRKDANQARFILNPDKPGGRAIGERLARQIEANLGMKRGALDKSPDGSASIKEEATAYIPASSPQAIGLIQDLMVVDRAGKLSPDLADSLSSLLRSTHPALFKKQPSQKKLLKAMKDGTLD